MGMNRSIYSIIGKEYSKDRCINEIQEEGYAYSFYFKGDCETEDSIKYQMDVADEIWIFGDVEGMFEYEYAIENGMDIWRMG